MPTLSTMTTDVLDHGFSTARYSTYASDKINEAYQEIARKLRLRQFYTEQSISVVAGTNSYALASDFIEADYLYNDTDNQLLIPMSGGGQSFEQINGSSSGDPSYWLILESNVRLYPTPIASGDTLKLRYWKAPAALTSGDTPSLPTSMHHMLVTYAVAKCYRREGDIQMHDAFMGHFGNDVSRAANDLQNEENPVGAPQQVSGPWGGAMPALP